MAATHRETPTSPTVRPSPGVFGRPEPTTAAEPDRLVKTHCCFCGQQCGIQLKVKDNQVIGFEPWEEFPFNRGMLCPKGVKRYLQGSHPDRLLSAFERDPTPARLQRRAVRRAIDRVAAAIQRIQSAHGTDAFAVLTGVSLTTEKAYLMGKFARVCLKTREHRLQRPALHGQRRGGQQEGVRRRPAANPWADILKAKVVWISGANIAECAPITTTTSGRPANTGAKSSSSIRASRPLARTCDLFLPVKPGRDIALFNGVLHLMIENDWIDHAFIEAHTIGFEKVAEQVRDWTPRHTAEVTGIAGRSIRRAAELWGTAPTSFLLHARGIEHHSHGVQNCLGAINMVLASGRIGREGCGYATITGQANGQGGREHGQKCDQLPGGRDIENPEHRAHVAEVWGVDPAELPIAGSMPTKSSARSTAAKSAASSASASTPRCRCRTATLSSGCWRNWSSTSPSTFPQRDGAARRHRPARIVAGGGRGRRHQRRGPRHQDQQGRGSSRRRPRGLAHHPGHCPQARPRARLHVHRPARDLRGARRASAGGVADYAGITYERLEREFGVFWPCPSEDHPGTPRLFEEGSWNPIARGKGRFYFPDGRARFHVAEYAPPAEDVDDDYPIMLTTGRVVSQFLSGTQTRRIGPLVDQCPEPRIEMHPRLAEKSAWPTATGPRSSRAAAPARCGRRW